MESVAVNLVLWAQAFPLNEVLR